MRILICDDSHDLLRVLEVMLGARGHTIDTAGNGEEAIKLFEAAGPAGYDLIITDQEMPGDSGFFVGGWVRAKGYTGRLAVMTGHQAEPVNLAKIDAEYWKKDVAMERLLDYVEGGRSG